VKLQDTIYNAILSALIQNNWVRAAAARDLGLKRTGLVMKMRALERDGYPLFKHSTRVRTALPYRETPEPVGTKLYCRHCGKLYKPE